MPNGVRKKPSGQETGDANLTFGNKAKASE